ncbi:MAG: N-acetylmuramic acid 6-phosphate etherase [Pirellulaceae bacterium]
MLHNLTTEQRNHRSMEIDTLSAIELVELINSEDAGIAPAVAQQSANIAWAIQRIADCFRSGGRLFYLGAGTSGRLGVLDASECPPTFNTPPEMVVGIIAGGDGALRRAVEGAEDDLEQAGVDLQQHHFSAADILVGIASSGRTPYVLGGLRYARSIGATTVGLTCNEQSEMHSECDLVIAPVVGPEVVSGSTRMKAGTATKLVLNMLTTGAMILIGKTYGNLMVDLRASNMKLKARSVRIVSEIAGLSSDAAQRYLAMCAGEVKTAIVAAVNQVDAVAARQQLQVAGGQLRNAIVLQSGRQAASAQPAECSDAALVLGVDGGGSKTVAWLGSVAEDELIILGRGQAGSGNLRSVGYESAFSSVDRAVAAAFADAGMPRSRVGSACLCLAGAGRVEEQQRVMQWAQSCNLARLCRVIGDSEAILAGAEWPAQTETAAANLMGRIALVCGTGSIAWGQAADGRTARSGGWGYMIDDLGSGFWLGQQLLQQAVQAADECRHDAPVLTAVLRAANCSSPSDLVEWAYAASSPRQQIAALSPLAFELANDCPAVAQTIEHGAESLARLVATVAEQMAKNPTVDSGYLLALAGGVLCQQPDYVDRILACLHQRACPPTSVCLVPNPVFGAVRQAAAQLYNKTRF